LARLHAIDRISVSVEHAEAIGENRVSAQQSVEISELVGNAKLGRFHLAMLVLCFLMIFFDAFDLSTVNVAAPALLRAFGGDKKTMGVVFGAGYFGILVGGWIIGYLSDLWGRRNGALLSIIAYSVPALTIPFAGSLNEIMYLRFLAGIGMGGVMPTTLAFLAETAPKRFRASFAMMALFGFPAGTAAIGFVAAKLIPLFGWAAVFFAAGGAGLALGILLFFALPESIQFLAVKRPHSPALPRMARHFAPALAIDATTNFHVRQAQKKEGFALLELFGAEQRLATALLWLAYFVEGLTYITISAWLTVVLEAAGLAPTDASLTFSYAALGGIVVACLLMRPLDRFGPMASVVTALIAIAAIVTLGTPNIPIWLIIASAIAVHSFCSATHSSLNGVVGLFYPTSIRSNGVGWASGLGRIASMIGPVVVGYLLAWQLPLRDVLYIVAAPYVVLVLACIGLGRLYQKKFAPGPVAIAPGLAPAIATVKERG
jgi:MFS transporter, AAHS family, 4-hydroxybenzoate transporter